MKDVEPKNITQKRYDNFSNLQICYKDEMNKHWKNRK